MGERVERRPGDMDMESRLEILKCDDADVHVTIYERGEDGLIRTASIEFCEPSIGGGRSPCTHAALVDVMRAMAADDAGHRTSAWQPIETAPRDGREFLVLTAIGPVVAHWRNESVTFVAPRRGSRGHGLRAPEGWILNGVTSRTVIVEPTHWMPIPAPPTTGDDK